jgi:hypothetical protein
VFGVRYDVTVGKIENCLNRIFTLTFSFQLYFCFKKLLSEAVIAESSIKSNSEQSVPYSFFESKSHL